MTISRGQMPRQMYGLGSLVKSITKPIKKVLKSDVGKVALLAGGAGLFGLGPLKGLASTGFGKGLSGFFGTGSFNPFKTLIPGVGKVSSPFGALASKAGITDLVTGNLTGFGKAAALTIPSVLAAAGVQDEEEIAELQQDKNKLAALLERGYKNLNINASDEEVDAFVRANVAEGGRMGFAMGDTAEENAIQAAGIMGLPLNENPAGVTELDLRETGGFIPPVGVKEKADDIPAMLSNNEFVFTADAVRNAGGGDINKGAQLMYDTMKKLESRVV